MEDSRELSTHQEDSEVETNLASHYRLCLFLGAFYAAFTMAASSGLAYPVDEMEVDFSGFPLTSFSVPLLFKAHHICLFSPVPLWIAVIFSASGTSVTLV